MIHIEPLPLNAHTTYTWRIAADGGYEVVGADGTHHLVTPSRFIVKPDPPWTNRTGHMGPRYRPNRHERRAAKRGKR